MDDYKRAQFSNNISYCGCCDVHPDKCKNDSTKRKARRRLKRGVRKALLEFLTSISDNAE